MHSKAIQEFIDESDKYGWHIEKQDNKYICTTLCMHCNQNFTKEITMKVLYPEHKKGKIKVQCNLPIYCNKCEDRT